MSAKEITVENEIAKIHEFGQIVTVYGKDVIVGLFILVAGLILARIIIKHIRKLLQRVTSKQHLISTVSMSLHLILGVVVVAQALHYVGVDPIIIRRTFVSITLAAVGLIVIFRPYIPTLPFKVGNTIKTGDLFGKVEATTFLNNRLRTFEGLTVFVPNRKILDDYLINYHFTPTRRVKVDVGIAYDQDILKAKQIMEGIMIADPRVKTKPRPAVYLLYLTDSCMTLGGRCWVENQKYWVTKCELIEKVKLRFDQEDITIAFPQRDVHLYHETPLPAFPRAGSTETMAFQSDRHAIDRV